MKAIMQKLSISGRIMIMVGTLSAFSMAILAFLAISSASDGMRKLAMDDIQHIAENVRQMCVVQDQLADAKLASDLALAETLVSQLADDPTAWERAIIRNADQMLHVGSFRLPALEINGTLLTGNHELTDRITQLTGSTATIFDVQPDRWVRVATSVRTADGQRADGTTIESSSPVYQHVMNGRTFTGSNLIAGQFFQTAYRPIRDASGRITSVLYVGVPHSRFTALQEAISEVVIGETGYIWAVNSQG